MAKFRANPAVEIEATQFFYAKPWPDGVTKADDGDYCVCYTAHGQRTVLADGDYIAAEPDNRGYYPIKPDIFERRWMPDANGHLSAEHAAAIEHGMARNTSRDDVMRETVAHVRRVGCLMLQAISGLQNRAVVHDDSKFSAEEFEAFARETPGLKALTYGSPEYKDALERLGPALRHHYDHNRHHPEYFGPEATDGMNLLDLIEMLADWKAATERHADGSLARSIVGNAKRFGYPPVLMHLLARSAIDLGWMGSSQWRNACTEAEKST